MTDSPYGYLLVHFIEDRRGHKEKIYFSLSDGDTPLRWKLANGGEPVLESHLGTTGVRDPHLVEGDNGWFLIATDLKIWPTDVVDWNHHRRHGSRSLVVWHSDDLVAWSRPWLAEVGPGEAGIGLDVDPAEHRNRLDAVAQQGEHLIGKAGDLGGLGR